MARVLTEDPAVERVIGVDVVTPAGDIGGADFVRADIRNPLIAKVISSAKVDTVVHMNRYPEVVRGRDADEGDERHRHHAVARCMPEVRSPCSGSCWKSTAAAYGSLPRDPGLFTEDIGRSL